ncbi:MAG: hypothetical protein IJK52_07160, partial [Oscillospiraceae bacterium]|nr:hypothetical protein [Oscillospiraceae bacterium]
DALMAALDIRRERRDAFIKRWRKVQERAIQWNEKTGKTYTRNQFYKDFIVQEGSNVDECLVDTGKPFSDELKEIIDFVYAMNLPDALNLTPAIPPDSPMTAFRYSERSETQGQREISAEELAFASEEFTVSVKIAMKGELSADSKPLYCKTPMPIPARTDFTLRQLYDIRKSKDWIHYLRKLTDGKTRSRLTELDFHNIPGVWESYCQVLYWMKENAETFSDCQWGETPAAVSVLYHFEETTLATVYERAEDGTPRLMMAFPDLEELLKRDSLQRKSALWIDYVCGNVLKDPRMNNLLLTEIRLFEGMTRVNGILVFDKLKCALCKSGFQRVPIPDLV